MSRIRQAAIDWVRARDRHRERRGDGRRVLVDARTPVNYVMVAPVLRAMARDPRVEFYFTASEEPSRLRDIYHEPLRRRGEAPPLRLVHPARAAFMRFDAYVASDFMWARLLRETCRIQVFHGVGGKYGFDAPTTSMREWHRLFFVNRRRLRNFIRAGAIDADSPAIRLVGYPKADCLVDGSLTRDAVMRELGFDGSRPTVLYAPTWSPASSLNAMGEEVVRGLLSLGVNVIVKLHDRSRDLREMYSGGVDWVARLQPLLVPGRAVIAPGHDISPYLVAADVMVTDHSSAGFEYLLLDRPIVRIHRPALLQAANVHPDYAELLASVAESVDDARGVMDATVRALADPSARSGRRREVAEDLFHLPGTATSRAVAELYDVLELEPQAAAVPLQEVRCQPSA
ncbi:MAG TPA: CDP-glycerol glycerophosphotransferase family protein [Vicinamibacterales bacterium]|nr:CDP-glycerol glycerophosphotransferase family protein [Vicinamibacterales bacterium]